MKVIYIYFFTGLLFMISCKKKENTVAPTENKNGVVTLHFENMVGNSDLQLNQMLYTNASGNEYSVSMLKYYVSNIELRSASGDVYKAGNYELIDESDPSSLGFSIGEIKAGTYDSLVFRIGIDPLKNHNGAQDGDLDVSKGMFWTWNTGYIFFKHEGQYRNSSSQVKPLIFHYATDAAYLEVRLPIALNVNGNREVKLKFDLNNVYTSPVNIDFNVDNNRQSTSGADATWIANIKSNFSDAFSVLEVK